MSRRWLVTGAGGMLGRDLVALLRAADVPVTALTRAQLDITDEAGCTRAVAGHDVVVNGAAWTAVDDAESHEPAAFAVNAVGAATLARACDRAGALLVQPSTDYVFAGDATVPYAPDDPVAPRTAYGRTKAAGEWAVRATCPRSLVVRTAWLYGEHGGSFVRTMLRLAGERDVVEAVQDQRGQPTWTRDVATVIRDLVDQDAPPGTYHATSAGETTWFGLARAVFATYGHDPARVRPTTSGRFVRPAPRPAYSVLAPTNGSSIGPWQQRLAAFKTQVPVAW